MEEGWVDGEMVAAERSVATGFQLISIINTQECHDTPSSECQEASAAERQRWTGPSSYRPQWAPEAACLLEACQRYRQPDHPNVGSETHL